MTPISYSFLLYLLSPLIWGYLLFRAIKSPEYREGFCQRLGLLPKNIPQKGILVHCASVGETRAAAPLIKKLVKAYPQFAVIVSTSTPTGKKACLELFGDSVSHCYLPIDWPGSSQRFIKRLSPKLVVLMETELWLNLLKSCKSADIPVLLANARLSDKSCEGYLKRPKFSQALFANISQIAAQFESDRANFERLGVTKEKLQVAGSIKFDLSISDSLKEQQKALKLAWVNHRPAWIAVSIHPGEFIALLETHKKLLATFPDLLMIAVPRHPEKFELLKENCGQLKLNYISRSQGQAPAVEHSVLVGDSMGEMTLLCGLADLAFVGGSLIEHGGQNPLEPLACGLPLIMGSSVYNFSDIAASLESEGLLVKVNEAEQLETVILGWLNNPAEQKEKSNQAKTFMLKNSGTSERLLTMCDGLLQSK